METAVKQPRQTEKIIGKDMTTPVRQVQPEITTGKDTTTPVEMAEPALMVAIKELTQAQDPARVQAEVTKTMMVNPMGMTPVAYTNLI
ncbi:MAG TPA: hypothetical protein DCY07_06665 [Rhodospirillaceae bacterium]|nr:hypothetical protein [Rhodospirillaceae bacterium]